MKNHQNGAVDMMLALALLAVVAVGGFVLYRINAEEDQIAMNTTQQTNQTSQQAKDKNEDEKTVQYEVSYKTWTEADKQSEDEDVVALYKSTNGTANLRVYGENNPRIYYSSNGPFYCRFESGDWQHYRGDYNTSENKIVYTKSADGCEDVEKAEINGLDTYAKFGGALARTKYVVAVNVDSEWYVFDDYRDYDVADETNTEYMNNLKATLKGSVESLISQTFVES